MGVRRASEHDFSWCAPPQLPVPRQRRAPPGRAARVAADTTGLYAQQAGGGCPARSSVWRWAALGARTRQRLPARPPHQAEKPHQPGGTRPTIAHTLRVMCPVLFTAFPKVAPLHGPLPRSEELDGRPKGPRPATSRPPALRNGELAVALHPLVRLATHAAALSSPPTPPAPPPPPGGGRLTA